MSVWKFACFILSLLVTLNFFQNNVERINWVYDNETGCSDFFQWFNAGLLGRDSKWEFLEITLLACFCTIHNHGFEMLFSFSAIVQHTPSTPVGFSILRAGFNKSVLLSVYTATTNDYCHDNPSHGISIKTHHWLYWVSYLICDTLKKNVLKPSGLIYCSNDYGYAQV